MKICKNFGGRTPVPNVEIIEGTGGDGNLPDLKVLPPTTYVNKRVRYCIYEGEGCVCDTSAKHRYFALSGNWCKFNKMESDD